MLPFRALLPTMLGLALLAGCASEGVDAPTTGSPSPGTTTTPSAGPSGDPSPTTDGDGEPAGGEATFVPWGAYRFDETVDPRSGGSGTVQSYAYRYTQEDAGETTTLDVAVENLGVSTESVRGQTMDTTTGTMTPVTQSVEVTKLRHTLTVVEDGSGERSAGDTAVATVWLPTTGSGGSAASFATLWSFVHVEFEDDGSRGLLEMVPTQAGATSFTAPYTEGDDPSSWWGFEHLVTTYALSWWAGLFEDASLEEGSHAFGGFQYSADREVLEVPGYSFDGWRVSWSGTSGTDSGAYTVAVAPELPLPFEQTFTSTSSGETTRMSYELTALELG